MTISPKRAGATMVRFQPRSRLSALMVSYSSPISSADVMPTLAGVSGHSNHFSPSGLLGVLLGNVCLLWIDVVPGRGFEPRIHPPT